jgi:hypothetical protein
VLEHQKYTAVRTAAGAVQLTVNGAARELTDVEAIDLALSLLAAADLPSLGLTPDAAWADHLQSWLNAQTACIRSFNDYADRRDFSGPPPSPETAGAY